MRYGSCGGARVIDDVGPLRKALQKKGGAYGDLAHPLILVINVERAFHVDDDTWGALFGSKQAHFTIDSPGAIGGSVGASGGYRLDATGWRHTNVTAVLVAEAMAPWLVSNVTPTLWLHPGAKSIRSLDVWRTAEIRQNQLQFLDARRDAADYFGLISPWPNGTPFPRRI